MPTRHILGFLLIVVTQAKPSIHYIVSTPSFLIGASFNVMACHGPSRVTLQNNKTKRARNLQCCNTLHQRREVPKPTLARLTSLAAPRVIRQAFTYIMRTCANASREVVVTAPCRVRMRACIARGGCNRPVSRACAPASPQAVVTACPVNAHGLCPDHMQRLLVQSQPRASGIFILSRCSWIGVNT